MMGSQLIKQSPQTQRNRKFVPSSQYLQSWNIHPDGHSITLTTRGKPFAFANWEGAVIQLNQENNGRYRLLQWLNGGDRLIAVTDQRGEEQFVVFSELDRGWAKEDIIEGLDIGRPHQIKVNPRRNEILFPTV